MTIDANRRSVTPSRIDWDPCGGGHVGFTYWSLGSTMCTRCGRPLDMAHCIHGLAVAFCTDPHDHVRASLVDQAKAHGRDPREALR